MLFVNPELTSPDDRVDDGDGLDDLFSLMGRSFLAMLARLERDNRLGPDSEVKNLGLIMSLFIQFARSWSNDLGLFERGKDETVQLTTADGSSIKYTFNTNDVVDYVLGYAARHNITLPDISQPPVEAADKLPPPTKEDPWDTLSAFLRYEKNNGKRVGPGRPATMGGDYYDITTMRPAERKSHSYNGRDPLSKKEIQMLRMGMILSME